MPWNSSDLCILSNSSAQQIRPLVIGSFVCCYLLVAVTCRIYTISSCPEMSVSIAMARSFGNEKRNMSTTIETAKGFRCFEDFDFRHSW